MLDVIEIVLDPVLHLLKRVCLAAPAVDLRPACYAGLYAMAPHISIDDLRVLLIVRDRVRPGADEAHLAAQHVEQLRQFVKTGVAQPMARACDSGIMPPRLLHEAARRLRCRNHRAELENFDDGVVEAIALLTE